MPVYHGTRPDGTQFAVDWDAVSPIAATIKGKSSLFCRFCLEGKSGIGILIEGMCSNGCKGSIQWMKEHPSSLKPKVEITEPEEKIMKEYVSDPRAIEYFPDVESRSHVAFSELAKAGSTGCLQSDLIAFLVDLTGATKSSMQTDVSAKANRWRKLADHPAPDKWWLFTSLEPKRGRPRKDAEGQRLWLVFNGDPIPDKVFVDPKAQFPKWVKDQLV